MTIPTYDKCMLPLLQFASDGFEHHVREATEALADYFNLTEQERNERMSNGQKNIFYDRLQWANTYLKKAGLLKSVSRGVFQITQDGYDALASNPTHIDREFLMHYPSFVEFSTPSSSEIESSSDTDVTDETSTPQETLQSSFQRIKSHLRQELLEQIMSCSPSFFEQLVVDLLLAMGYGRSLEGAGKIVGRSGDGGIDGIISEDKLGFDVIYVQAKRWEPDSTVGRPTVQAFAGSLLGQGVTKGVLITTSKFSREAEEYARNTQQLRIILIDGQQLAELMIDHDIGVSLQETYTIKKIDLDYFDLE